MTAADVVSSTIARIGPLDAEAFREATEELNRKTKPRGSLGELERIASQLAGIRGNAIRAGLECALVVAAGDHGYAAEGASAYPAEVTRQMALNFATGGAAVCVLAREVGARLVVVDAGVAQAVDHPAVRPLRFGPGTANATRGAAMSRAHALDAVAGGIALAEELAAEGIDVVGLGEMGIGNTTAASALHAALLGVTPAGVCGPGTGLDEGGIRRKVAIVGRALEANAPLGDPVDVLAALGGFEIAFLVGVALGAAAERVAVVLDGFVVGAAALVAARLAPGATAFMIAAHLSPEPGHALALEALGLEPLLRLGLRLGEATGAALAIPLLRSAVAILTEMATFEQARVTDAGR